MRDCQGKPLGPGACADCRRFECYPTLGPEDSALHWLAILGAALGGPAATERVRLLVEAWGRKRFEQRFNAEDIAFDLADEIRPWPLRR